MTMSPAINLPTQLTRLHQVAVCQYSAYNTGLSEVLASLQPSQRQWVYYSRVSKQAGMNNVTDKTQGHILQRGLALTAQGLAKLLDLQQRKGRKKEKVQP